MEDSVSRSPDLRASPPPDPANDPSNFYRQFLRRSALVTVLLAILPIFPSIAPQFVNQTLHARSWELLQLVFVGIAVSYGLFSRKNDQTEKDHGGGGPKPESAHSYVSKLLQFSSVFDDEPGSPQAVIHEESKVQTLNSQYFRGEPVVMVAEQIQSNPVVREKNGFCEITHNKPLLLPIRSLKQLVPESGEVDSGEQLSRKSDPVKDSVSSLNGDSKKSRNVEVLGSSPPKVEDDLVVLRSPIPWRSRSGRMMKMDENEDMMKSNSIDDSKFNPNLSTRKMLTQSTYFPSESRPKSSLSSPPPTPPPPPPPQFVWKSMILKSSSSFTTNNSAPLEKVLRRSAKSVPTSETKQLPRRMTNNNVAEFVGYTNTTEFFKKNGYSGKGLPNRNSVEKDVMETSDDDSEDDDYFEGISCLGGDVTNSSSIVNNDDDISNNGDLGPDVDKKADEFIAKFREQIRLQRIESIRKSAAQRGAKACGAR
ncbi:hydroxyproline-rich glycoprotein family protein [Striga asiatica]|uniref:Hydroxyproline-rich glycoprotein family protein n=1 Tax=Striga asiatica TaxID=4170 RepID=A0A5A7PPA0_STRAF|nr:hydroxyproline-rich glycoprotein family protein [Striga asiatica]